MNDETIYVRLNFEVQVTLPEGTLLDKDDKLTVECRDRAIEAALGAISQACSVYIDGDDSDPAEIFIDISDNDIEEVRVE